MVNLPDLQIPAVINPENTRCIQIQIPDDETWITDFVNLLSIPKFWFNWQRTGDNTGKQLADVWSTLFDQIDWSTMSCCCNQPPAIFRYNSDGVYQMSTDGGETWTDAPGYDYRNTSTTFPPPSAIGIDNTKCQAADSAVKTIDTEIVQALNESFAAAQILALIAAVLLAVLSAGSLAALTPLITAIGSAIIDVGVTATQAAFTTDVWDRLRCNIFCHMDSSSSINAAGISGILSQITTDETGIVQTVLYGIVNAAGVVGITNMIRSNKGDPDSDCTGCGCGDCMNLNDWGIMTYDGHAVGVEVSRGDNYIILQGTSHPDFGTPWNAIIKTPSTMDCCKVTAIDTISGDGSDYHFFHVECGLTQWPAGSFTNFAGIPEPTSSNQIFIRKDSGTNFVVKITFAAP